MTTRRLIGFAAVNVYAVDGYLLIHPEVWPVRLIAVAGILVMTYALVRLPKGVK